ncbi:FISUMP domain-containing protein [Pseudomonas baetica]|uniref:FISUMP domain-containing protein n=1 Tax=Pseudomonas baetica TaxID=674054 RepID=UPI002871120F|nr:FISUMP domain-containing protein [Pseudomonas baetica]MDR9864964.1 FISUMP domain-containing protein [Pseudomonas baetica]
MTGKSIITHIVFLLSLCTVAYEQVAIASSSTTGTITTLDCIGAAHTGSLIADTAAVGVSSAISYTGGNGGAHPGQVVTSTGVTGLTATLLAGDLAVGPGTVISGITGAASEGGRANFVISLGGQSCTLVRIVTALSPVVGALTCPAGWANGKAGVSYSETRNISYTAGNGAPYPAQKIASTGVTGLTAAIAEGKLTSGSGTIPVTVTGTPIAAGTASFAASLGGKSCSFSITVDPSGPPVVVLPGNPQAWMKHNLGAKYSNDPDVPVKEIHGNLYQWGRYAMVADTNTPSGPIPGWNTVPASDGSWRDANKTANDPCPAGFRVPSGAQWQNLISSNAISNVGTWKASPTNFGSAMIVTGDGNKITLPAAGYRLKGPLLARGQGGGYWSSSQYYPDTAHLLYVDSATMFMGDGYRTEGFSVRCISE